MLFALSAQLRVLASVLTVAAISGCGGGGGGGDGNSNPPQPPDPPTVSLEASQSSVLAGESSTLSWFSSDATACTASGDWSGSRGTAGTEDVGPLNASASFELSCTGSGGSASDTTNIVVTTGLGGALLVPATARVDSDTNDSLLTPVSNNTFADAQTLSNPALVGGYVNQPGAGAEGPMMADGDVSDLYAANLLEGQVIELAVANPDPAADDLDLELYDSNETVIDASIGIGRIEQLTVAASGDYFVRVVAVQGASNYVLSIGQTGTTAAGGPTLRANFVPGEALAKLAVAEARKGNAAQTRNARDAAVRRYSVVQAGGGPERELLFKSTSHTLPQLIKSSPSIASEIGGMRFANSADRAKWETLQLIKRLSTDPAFAWAEPNYVLSTQVVPDDTLYSLQRWHYELINLPAAWEVSTGSANVIVAVVDTGVQPHFELAPKLVSGFDFVRGANSGDGDGMDNDPRDPGVPQLGGYSFHGTHVAGTMVASSNDADGAAGVTWEGSIMPIRVLGADGFGSTADIIQGVRFAAGLANDSGFTPAVAADVINLSLGGPGLCASAWQSALNEARAAGTIVVAAAGNSNTNGNFHPAGCSGVISVSAVDANRTRAPYSNFGTGVDVAAPGGNLAADFNGDGYPDGVFSTYAFFDGSSYFSDFTFLQGTSMAAPHVSGVVALMKSVNPGLTPDDFDALLASGVITDDIGAPGADELGVGLINAFKAVQAAGGPPVALPPQLGVVASSINFGDLTAFNEVVVSNAGGGSIAVTGATVSEPWLSVATLEVDGNGLGTYRIEVVRDGLVPGTYNGWVEFAADAGTPVRTNVLMQVSTTALTSDAGQHYVLLVDPATFETVYQAEVRAIGPLATYTFGDLEVGDYLLIAGTDLDNDLFICDDGEACGEYPVFGAIEVIPLVIPRSGVDFATGFRSSMTQQVAGRPGTPKRGFARLR